MKTLITLTEYNNAYLKYILGDSLIISGKLNLSDVITSLLTSRKPEGYDFRVTEIVLPAWLNIDTEKYRYISCSGLKVLNKYINSHLEKDFHLYLDIMRNKVDIKSAIWTFMETRELPLTDKTYEFLKKREFRSRENLKKKSRCAGKFFS
ncbi:MAG: hypothetical protein N4A72_00830 [Bacteroidales bacterium]|jgi:hypothetical protein|nr:hypothetical protein [Bacteroidales bacterium]